MAPQAPAPAADLAAHRWRSPLLGEPLTLELSCGRLQAFVRGSGPAVVLAHGWLVNANAWRGVVDRLAGTFRCVALDLPLGSHRVAAGPGADLSPEGVGDMVAEALAALDLRDATLVGNDSGGAYAQIATARHPDRVGRLVLASCETPYDEWPPPPFDGLPAAVEDPALLEGLLAVMRDPELRRGPAGYGLVAKRPLDERASASYALACVRDAEVLDDARRAIAAASAASVRAAASRLIERFRRPVLFVWAAEDTLFPLAHARRYAARLADARVETVDDSLSLTPEDRPDALAEAIARFAAAPRSSGGGAAG